jgi:hypothetical protein
MLRLVPVLSLLLLFAGPVVGQQADPAALFEQGSTWTDFLSNARSQRERWTTNTGRAAPAPVLVERLRAVSTDLKILAIAEAGCSDSVSTLPYLAKLAEQAGVALRIVGSTAGRHIMEQHRTPDGRPATPTMVLLRGAEVAGVWIEWPSALQDWFLSAPAQALTQQDRISRKMSWYDWDRGDSTLVEIVALAERSASPPPFTVR